MLQTEKTAVYGRIKHIITVLCSTAVLIICLSVLCAFSIVKNVEIDNGYGRVISAVSMKDTVGDILDEQQITLNEGDIVSPSLETVIQHKDKIVIYRSVGVTITADGESMEFRTTARDVQQALSKAGVSIGEHDEYNYPIKDKLFEGIEIAVTRIEKTTAIEEEAVPYSVVTEADANLAEGVEQVIQEGQDGVLTKTYTITTRDGVEESRELVSEVVTVQPVNKIVKVGSQFQLGGTLPDSVLQSKRSMVMNASAYDLSFESCGKYPGDPGYGITASGMQACYGIVAVDPNVIPLGTRLYIASADGSYVYGCAIAGDTGGGIKGNKIDLFYNSRAEALNFGRRNVVVYFL